MCVKDYREKRREIDKVLKAVRKRETERVRNSVLVSERERGRERLPV